MTGCKKTCLISAVAVFIFLFAYEWLVHGMLLHSLYMSTAPVWRPMEEMQQMMPWTILRYAALSLLFAGMYKKCKGAMNACAADGLAAPREGYCPVKSGGLCFGVAIGLIMGITQAGNYAYLPIPGTLAAAWLLAGILEGAGVGVILSAICHAKGDRAA